jgi:hypothetical protein
VTACTGSRVDGIIVQLTGRDNQLISTTLTSNGDSTASTAIRRLLHRLHQSV